MVLEILKHLDNLDLVMVFNKSGEETTISVLPKPKTSDESAKNLAPFIVKGKEPSEIESALIQAISNQLPQVSNLTSEMNAFIKSVEDMKAKSKMADAKKAEAKKIAEKIKKELENVQSLIDEDKLDEAEKHVKKALKLDNENAKAKEFQADINSKRNAGTLFGTNSFTPTPQEPIQEVVKQPVVQPTSVEVKPQQPTPQPTRIDVNSMTQEQIEALIAEREERYNQ